MMDSYIILQKDSSFDGKHGHGFKIYRKVFVSLLLLPFFKGDLSIKIFQNFCPFL